MTRSFTSMLMTLQALAAVRAQRADLLDALERLHIHLSGIEYGPKGEKNHLKLSEADLDLKAIFRALHEFGCGGRILCESPIMEEDALNMKKTWMKVSGEKE